VLTDNYIYTDLAKYKLRNKLNGPVGFVQIFNDNKLVESKSNLVLGSGRSVGAQRLFNTNITEFFEELPDYTNHVVSHFGIGAGGATISGNTDYTLHGPHICDQSLYKPISLGNIGAYLNDTDDFEDPDKPELYNSSYVLKEIAEKSLIETQFPTNPLVDEEHICSYFTKVKCRCVVDGGEPSALNANESVQISEAGLYAVHKDYNNQDVSPDPVMFAHISFSPKFKEKEKQFGILWYILC